MWWLLTKLYGIWDTVLSFQPYNVLFFPYIIKHLLKNQQEPSYSISELLSLIVRRMFCREMENHFRFTVFLMYLNQYVISQVHVPKDSFTNLRGLVKTKT